MANKCACQSEPDAATYLRIADIVQNLCPNECHSAIYRKRASIAQSLRKMAASPANPEHIAALDALRTLFVYVRLP